MQGSVEGKVVLITGPARGIGAATARVLAARGAHLSLVGLETARLDALCSELGAGHVRFACDVTDQNALERAVKETLEALGRIDVVVANAGIASNGTVAIAPVEALVRTIEVNLIGVVRTVSATLPHVTASRGYYLLVSSAAALAPLPGISTYAASKSGVEQFGNAFRLEVAHKGVGVGVAHPSWIDTDLVRDQQRDLACFNEMLLRLPGPFGSVTSVEECANAFVRAIERRQRKVYVPRTLAPFAALRQFFMSSLSDYIMGRHARRFIPAAEREIAALGRSFGATSVESADEARTGGAET
ncbi:MAG TPA: SDR family oxidoreductase [Pyrinomonadaceae bacterium]|jgi:short-subunit dehydrogenase|nr:SDR family oxidoreductase [Pyrinomonadaceae bacterium]